MLLKSKDSCVEGIQELRKLLELKITAKQRFEIDRQLKCLISGNRNEQNSAYYLDFRYKDSLNWALIHDLRIEHRGRVAQIDHLLINRFLDVYVLESKNYYYGVKITEEGEFLVWDGKGYQVIESPYEQNQRHIMALQAAIEDRNLSPLRLGFAIPINFRNVVLISPTSKLLKPNRATFDLSTVIKADTFVTSAETNMNKKSIIEAPKIIGSDTLRDFGEKLVRLHRPGSFDYAARYDLKLSNASTKEEAIPVVVETVRAEIPPAVAKPEVQQLCRKCQSDNLSILYGKFGYYFKCNACEGNTPIKISCGKDGHNERLRKDGLKFYRECADCGSSKLYFENK